MPSNALLTLAIVILLGNRVTSLIVPEEIPTVLSLIYSNIPPIKKGTDSRIGIGFRLGEHADFQTIVEIGPQKYTGKIGADADGDSDTKRKRAVILTAAMKGDLGPWAKAVATAQLESKLKDVLQRYNENSLGNVNRRDVYGKNIDEQNKREPLEEIQVPINNDNDNNENNWLQRWSQAIKNKSDPSFASFPRKFNEERTRVNRITVTNGSEGTRQSDLELLQGILSSKSDPVTN